MPGNAVRYEGSAIRPGVVRVRATVPNPQRSGLLMPDPNDPKAPTRRQTDQDGDDWSEQRRNGFRFKLFGQSITLPERLVFAAFLAVMLLWVLGAFSGLGWDSPVIPRDGTAKAEREVLQALKGRLPVSRQEHLDILEELLVTNYVLTECLRVKGECPKLSKPRRLKQVEERP